MKGDGHLGGDGQATAGQGDLEPQGGRRRLEWAGVNCSEQPVRLFWPRLIRLGAPIFPLRLLLQVTRVCN